LGDNLCRASVTDVLFCCSSGFGVAGMAV
jgi:hypothetical protein